jgi:hypothetical protein
MTRRKNFKIPKMEASKFMRRKANTSSLPLQNFTPKKN